MPDNAIDWFNAGVGMVNSSIEQRARAAEQQIRERLLTQQITEAQAKLQRDQAYRSELAPAMIQHAQNISKYIYLPPPQGEAGPPQKIENPNRMSTSESLQNTILPIVSKYEPDKVPQFLQAGALEDLRASQVDLNKVKPDIEQSKIDAALNRVQTQQEGASQRNTERIQAGFEKQKEQMQHDFDLLKQKHEDTLDQLDFKKQQAVELETMRERARAAIAEGQVSREQWLNRHLNTTVKDIASTRAGAKLKPEERNAMALKMLSDSWQAEIGAQRGDKATPKATPQRVRVKSPSGKIGNIPADQLPDAIKQGYQEVK